MEVSRKSVRYVAKPSVEVLVSDGNDNIDNDPGYFLNEDEMMFVGSVAEVRLVGLTDSRGNIRSQKAQEFHGSSHSMMPI